MNRYSVGILGKAPKVEITARRFRERDSYYEFFGTEGNPDEFVAAILRHPSLSFISTRQLLDGGTDSRAYGDAV